MPRELGKAPSVQLFADRPKVRTHHHVVGGDRPAGRHDEQPAHIVVRIVYRTLVPRPHLNPLWPRHKLRPDVGGGHLSPTNRASNVSVAVRSLFVSTGHTVASSGSR